MLKGCNVGTLKVLALVGVVTNKYHYLKMKYNAGPGIPVSKNSPCCWRQTNNGE